MEVNKEYEDRYRRAKARVDEIKSFYGHLTTYVIIVGAMFIFAWYTDTLRYKWVYWAAGGWALGLCVHAFRTFVPSVFMGSEWEEKKIDELMREEEQKNNRYL